MRHLKVLNTVTKAFQVQFSLNNNFSLLFMIQVFHTERKVAKI